MPLYTPADAQPLHCPPPNEGQLHLSKARNLSHTTPKKSITTQLIQQASWRTETETTARAGLPWCKQLSQSTHVTLTAHTHTIHTKRIDDSSATQTSPTVHHPRRPLHFFRQKKHIPPLPPTPTPYTYRTYTHSTHQTHIRQQRHHSDLVYR